MSLRHKTLRAWLLGGTTALLIGGFFVYGGRVEAASLSLNPPIGTYVVGDVVSVDVFVETGGQVVNAFSGSIDFDPTALRAKSVSRTNSVVDLWLVEPSVVDSRTVTFEGLVVHPGFQGTGKVITIQFEVLKEGSTSVSFSSGLVLANDGYGTNILDDVSDAVFTVLDVREQRSRGIELPPDEGGVTRVIDQNTLAPVVLTYTREANVLDELTIRGVTYPEVRVNVYLKSEDEEVVAYNTVSDSGGNFVYVHGKAETFQKLSPANVFAILAAIAQPSENYEFWLTAVRDGAETEATQPFGVIVGGESPIIILLVLGGLLLIGLVLFGVSYTRKAHVQSSSQIRTIRKDVADVAFDVEKYEARKRQDMQLGKHNKKH